MCNESQSGGLGAPEGSGGGRGRRCAVPRPVGRHPAGAAAVPGRPAPARTAGLQWPAAPLARNRGRVAGRGGPGRSGCGAEQVVGWAAGGPVVAGDPAGQLRPRIAGDVGRHGRDRPGQERTHLCGVAAAQPGEQVRGRGASPRRTRSAGSRCPRTRPAPPAPPPRRGRRRWYSPRQPGQSDRRRGAAADEPQPFDAQRRSHLVPTERGAPTDAVASMVPFPRGTAVGWQSAVRSG